jgi:hypothetical protein
MPRRTRSLSNVEQVGGEEALRGAQANEDMVNVLRTSYEHLSVRRGRRGTGPAELQTRLVVEAWVRNIAYAKEVWVEAVLLDTDGTPVRTDRFRLDHLGPGGGDGDRFGMAQKLPSPGPFPDGRRLQYRIFYRVAGDVFTDGRLHEHPLPPPTSGATLETTAGRV